MTLELIDEAVRSGARLAAACRALGLSARTVARWRAEAGGEDGRAGPRHAPLHELTEAERRRIDETAHSLDFRNLSPKQIVPRPADRGVYVASESSFYRVLREQGLLAHRNPARPARVHRPRALVARRPNQVWCWDITYLRSAVRGALYFLYLIVDIYSRKIVGWSVEIEASMLAAARLVEQACGREGVGSGCLVLHADNGGPMKGSTMLATLQRLGVVPSFSPLASAMTTPTRRRFSAPSSTGPSTHAGRSLPWSRRASGSSASLPGTTASTCTAASASSRPTTATAVATARCSPSATPSTSGPAAGRPGAGAARHATGRPSVL
ncbi:DDE-type integrase/transposase/recombinase [Sorangium sp. So ce1036]